MAQDPNPNVTIPGSGVLLHVLNTTGDPVPVQGNDDGAITTTGGGGGTVDQGAAGVASWKVVEDNSAAIKTAVESLDTKATADPATDTSVQAVTTALGTINTTLGTPLQAGGNVAVTSLPGSPAQEHITAGSFHSARLTDGAAFYKGAIAGDNMGADLRVAGAAVANGNPVPISDAGGSITVDGSVSITGTPSVTVSSGSITETNSSTIATNTGRIPAQGQALAAASTPVVLPLSQAAGALALQAQLPAALVSGRLSVDVGATAGLTDTQLRASAVPVSLSSLPALATGSNTIGKVDQGTGGISAWKVDGSAVTQPVSDAGGSLTVDSAQLPAALGAGGGIKVDGSGTALPISAASLPLPSGASTAAKQPALGTAGTPSTDVISVQGVGGGTAIPVSATSLPLPTGAATSALQGGGLPAALVGGRLDVNTGAWLGSTAPTVGQKAMANSLPVAIASDQSAVPVSGTVTVTPSGTQNVAAASQAATAFFPVQIAINNSTFAPSAAPSANLTAPSNTAVNSSYVMGRAYASAGSPGNGNVLHVDNSGRIIAIPANATSTNSQISAFDPIHTGPFNDLIAEGKTPVLSRHWTILNAFDPQQDETVTQANGATVTVSSQRMTLTTGTTNAADACYRTIKTAQYRPGQGFIFRWTAAFTTGVANSTQEIGFGNGANGGGGNAIAVGYNGTSFGILHRNAGSSTWTAQASWNGDKCNGTGASGFTLTPTNGNVYMAAVPFLGYGDIQIFVQDSTTGRFLLAHTIRYTNSSTSLEFSDPAFRFYGRAVSTGSTTNLVAYAGSASAFVVGKVGDDGQQWAVAKSLSVNNTTAAVLSIRCATTVNGALNNTPLRIRSISTSSDGGNATALVTASYGVTLGGTPAFAAFTGKTATTADNGVTLTNATTIGTFDTAGTTITGGDPIWNTTGPRNSTSPNGELATNPIFIWPGQTLTFYVTNLGATSEITIAVNGTVG